MRNDGRGRQLIYELNLAVRAPRKPFSILGFANRTKHVSSARFYYTPSNHCIA